VLFLPIFEIYISIHMVLHSSFLGKYYFLNPKSFGEGHQWKNLGCGRRSEQQDEGVDERMGG